MTLHEQHQRARGDALALLTSLQAADAETAARVYEDAPDPGLVTYVLALMFLEALREQQRATGVRVSEALRSMGIANAEMA